MLESRLDSEDAPIPALGQALDMGDVRVDGQLGGLDEMLRTDSLVVELGEVSVPTACSSLTYL